MQNSLNIEYTVYLVLKYLKIRLKDIPKNLDLETSLDLGTADADTEAVL